MPSDHSNGPIGLARLNRAPSPGYEKRARFRARGVLETGGLVFQIDHKRDFRIPTRAAIATAVSLLWCRA